MRGLLIVLAALAAGCGQLFGLDDPQLAPGRDGGLDDASAGSDAETQDALVDGGILPDGGSPATAVATAFVTNTQNLSSFPFIAVAIGTPAADRYIVVLAHGRSPSSDLFSNPTLTIDGTAMTRVIASPDNASAAVTALFIAPFPTGQFANFQLSYTGGGQDRRAALGVWAVRGLSSTTPIDTALFDNVDPGTIQLDVVAGGVAFAGVSMSTVPMGTTGQWNTGTTYGQDVDASWFAGTGLSTLFTSTQQLEHDSSDPVTSQVIVGASFR